MPVMEHVSHEWEACEITDVREFVCSLCRQRVAITGMALVMDKHAVTRAMLAAPPCSPLDHVSRSMQKRLAIQRGEPMPTKFRQRTNTPRPDQLAREGAPAGSPRRLGIDGD